jgi:uncharacterized protein YjbI with pentapeptide repeats
MFGKKNVAAVPVQAPQRQAAPQSAPSIVKPQSTGSAEAKLRASLRAGDAQTRADAARALGAGSDNLNATYLSMALDDENHDVRRAAAMALASIWKRDQRAGNPACDYLRGAVSNKDEAVRAIAKDAMRTFIGDNLIEIHHKATGAFVSAFVLKSFRDSRINGSNLAEADLRGHDFTNAFTQAVNFAGADLRGVCMRGGNSSEADFKGADLRQADLTARNLWGADMRNANMEEALLERTTLHGVNLSEANLRKANLFGATGDGQITLVRAILSEANCEETQLYNANMENCDLEGAILRTANLHGANLQGANLRRADLRSKDRPKSALMSGETHLEGADLSTAVLDGARLDGAIYDHDTKWPPGFDPGSAGARL